MQFPVTQSVLPFWREHYAKHVLVEAPNHIFWMRILRDFQKMIRSILVDFNNVYA